MSQTAESDKLSYYEQYDQFSNKYDMNVKYYKDTGSQLFSSKDRHCTVQFTKRNTHPHNPASTNLSLKRVRTPFATIYRGNKVGLLFDTSKDVSFELTYQDAQKTRNLLDDMREMTKSEAELSLHDTESGTQALPNTIQNLACKNTSMWAPHTSVRLISAILSSIVLWCCQWRR